MSRPKDPQPGPEWKPSRTVRVVGSLLPVTLLVVGAELAVRACGLDQPTMRSPLMPTELAHMDENDDELFWKMKPNLDIQFMGARVTTNGLGLRSPEIGPREDGEFRVLSLGESTTFGYGVAGDATYSARLESLLRESDPTRPYRVINAGVCAYSSFQSLKYLELRGLELEPDLVLFYHELNDLLPSTAREGESRNEAAFAKSDWQLYESRKLFVHRKMLEISGVYRWITWLRGRRQLDELARQAALAQVEHGPRLGGAAETRHGVISVGAARRVSGEERTRILERLLALSQARGIQLVLFHPSYAAPEPHECELTEFASRTGVPLFDAHDALHPEGPGAGQLFLDPFHPSALGHERLARALFDFLSAEELLPAARASTR